MAASGSFRCHPHGPARPPADGTESTIVGPDSDGRLARRSARESGWHRSITSSPSTHAPACMARRRARARASRSPASRSRTRQAVGAEATGPNGRAGPGAQPGRSANLHHRRASPPSRVAPCRPGAEPGLVPSPVWLPSAHPAVQLTRQPKPVGQRYQQGRPSVPNQPIAIGRDFQPYPRLGGLHPQGALPDWQRDLQTATFPSSTRAPFSQQSTSTAPAKLRAGAPRLEMSAGSRTLPRAGVQPQGRTEYSRAPARSGTRR